MKPEHIRKKQEKVPRRIKSTPERPFLIEWKNRNWDKWRVLNRFATKGQRDRAWSQRELEEKRSEERRKLRPVMVEIGGNQVNFADYFKDLWTYRKRDV